MYVITAFGPQPATFFFFLLLTLVVGIALKNFSFQTADLLPRPYQKNPDRTHPHVKFRAWY